MAFKWCVFFVIKLVMQPPLRGSVGITGGEGDDCQLMFPSNLQEKKLYDNSETAGYYIM